MTTNEKLAYLDFLRPCLAEAFARGERTYSGNQKAHCPRIMARQPDEDIRHVTNCHIMVRLREAEDAADGGDMTTALHKIESAIGYLVILHSRVSEKEAERA